MSGYFNGSDPKHIYLKPNLRFKNVDLDKLMFKFEFWTRRDCFRKLHGNYPQTSMERSDVSRYDSGHRSV